MLCGMGTAVIFYPIKYLVSKKNFLKPLIIPILTALLALFYVVFSVLFEFASFRLYMFIGISAGFALNFKSLSVVLAFFGNMFYNKTDKRKRKVNKNVKGKNC